MTATSSASRRPSIWALGLALALLASVLPGLAWADAGPADRAHAEIDLPTADSTTDALLNKVDKAWSAKLAACAKPEQSAVAKQSKACAKLIENLGKLCKSSPVACAHVVGSVVLSERAALVQRVEALHPELLAEVSNIYVGDTVRSLGWWTVDRPTLGGYYAAWLARALDLKISGASPRVHAVLADFWAVEAEKALGVAICVNHRAGATVDSANQRCPKLWRAWLHAHRHETSPQWKAWDMAQVVARLSAHDWPTRLAALERAGYHSMKLESLPAYQALLRAAVTEPHLAQELVIDIGNLTTPFGLHAVLHPAGEPTSTWAWALVVLPPPPEAEVDLPTGPTPILVEATLAPVDSAKLAKLRARLDRALGDCGNALEGREEPDTGPKWCHKEAYAIAKDAGPRFSALLVAQDIVGGSSFAVHDSNYSVPMATYAQQNVENAAEAPTALAGLGLAWQQLVAQRATLKSDELRDKEQNLFAWGQAILGTPLCGRAVSRQPLDCADLWIRLAHRHAKSNVAQLRKWLAHYVRAELASRDGQRAWQAAQGEGEGGRIAEGGQGEDDPLEKVNKQWADWAKRNVLLQGDVRLATGEVADLIGDVMSHREVLYPAPVAGLHTVNLAHRPHGK